MKRFVKNDEGFVCAHCGCEVPPLGQTSRNHCPRCLWSVHLDINPGDRAAGCGGLMEPVKAVPDSRKGFVIIHRCTKCGKISRCKAAYGAKVFPDDTSLLIKLTAADFDEKV
ncbi:MAG: RNHCP domain-containing protein [Clostridia bacterium]|nr:RNHCP domain-containing protein [Clostridia bacterium]